MNIVIPEIRGATSLAPSVPADVAVLRRGMGRLLDLAVIASLHLEPNMTIVTSNAGAENSRANPRAIVGSILALQQ